MNRLPALHSDPAHPFRGHVRKGYSRAGLHRALLVLLAVTSAMLGCREDVAPPGQSLFDQAAAAYLEGRFHEAGRLFRRHWQRTLDRDQAAEARLWEGMCALETGGVPSARRCFEAVLAERPDGALAARALQGLARAAFVEREYARSAALYERLWKQHREAIDQAEALSAWAACLAAEGRDARDLLDTLRTQYPQSPYAAAGLSQGPGGGRYLVQAGAFLDAENAEALVERLKRAGFAAFRDARPLGSRTLHVVQAGAFSTRARAAAQVFWVAERVSSLSRNRPQASVAGGGSLSRR